MTTEFSEALGAITESIQVAPEKVPEGKVVVAVELSRDEKVSGRYMTSVTHGWSASGLTVALRNGHVVAANAIFGRWHNGVPSISPCHKTRCKTCGKLVPEPFAAWVAKDAARAAGSSKGLDGLKAKAILAQFGHCECGGNWGVDKDAEKAELTAFSQRVLKAVEAGGQVPPFLPPRAFTVHGAAEAVDLGPDWSWLGQAMAKNGKAALPFRVRTDGDAILFNPGFWLGWVDKEQVMDTGLFFHVSLEAGNQSGRRGGRFNPAGIDGL